MSFAFASDLLATVNDKILPGKAADQIGTFSAGMKLFTSSGRTDAEGRPTPQTLEELLSPDEYIRRELRVARNGSRGSYKGYDVLPTAQTRTIDAAKQNWFEYFCQVLISDDEEIADRGTEATINLWESRIDGAVADLNDMIATGIYNSTALKTGLQSKGFDGLRVLCSNSRTWMGIDSTSNTYWNPGLYDSTGYTIADLTDPTNANFILKLIRSAHLTLDLGGGQKVTNILTTKTVWGYIAAALEAVLRYQPAITIQAGIEGFTYDGIRIEWDSYCPAYHMFFISKNGLGTRMNIGLKGRRDRWFFMRPPVTPEDQMAKVATMVVHGMLYCDEPRLQGVYTSLGAS